jgi:hypothetical protein
MSEPEDVVDYLDKMIKRERNTPPIGSVDNPYLLYVPSWIEDRAIAEGTTSQEKADELFRYHVKVIIVEAYP